MSGDDAIDILLVEDDDDLREAIATGLRLAGFVVAEASNGQTALRRLEEVTVGTVVSDIRMPLLDGRQLLGQLTARGDELPVILMTGHGDIDQAVEAIRQGAYDFLAKPFAIERLVDTVHRALDKRLLLLENRQLRARLDAAQGQTQLPLIGRSPAIAALIAAIRQIGTADIDVLIEGERGSGKAAVAAMLHNAGGGSATGIEWLDCDFTPAATMERALGLGRGQGARTVSPARAPGGTSLVFGHVDRLAPALQMRLLHFLEARDRMTPEQQAAAGRTRILSTAASGVAELAGSGGFHRDLFHRIAAVRLQVPPLRARRRDLPELFSHFAQNAAERFRRDVPPLSAAISVHLDSHDWPGNLPELQHYAERIVLAIDAPVRPLPLPGKSLPDSVADFEAEMIRSAIRKEGGNIRKACLRLAVPRKTMYDKIRKYRIDLDDLRA